MTTQTLRNTEAGFTLVELAIVLMIIGLLIGGILRGQELMENARVTSTIQQTKAYDGAVTTFRDQYSAMPGDIANPQTRLANCTVAPCSTTGNGNGIIGTPAANLTGYTQTIENTNFWGHMAATHLISGVNPASAAVEWGQSLPSAKIAGGFQVVHMAAAATANNPALSGPFVILVNNPAGTTFSGTSGVNAISPLRASQIDRKLDDGLPRSGDVIGLGANADCTGPVYVETSEQKDCNLLIRIQN